MGGSVLLYWLDTSQNETIVTLEFITVQGKCTVEIRAKKTKPCSYRLYYLVLKQFVVIIPVINNKTHYELK